MSLADRAGNAMKPIVFTAEVVYFLLRLLLSISLAISIGFMLCHVPLLSSLIGSAAFAIGAALGSFAITWPLSFSSRRFEFHRWWVEALRAGLLVAFVVAACALRVYLERFDLQSGIAQLFLGLFRLRFLTRAPALWRVPVPLFLSGLLVAVAVAFIERPQASAFDGPNPDEKVLRGPRRVLYPAVEQRHRLRYGHLPCISWCLVSLPIALARLGLRLIGSTGSGKTILLTLLLKSFLQLVKRNDGLYRAYVLDVTNDYRPIIEALLKGSGVKTYLLHPTDRHSCCFDVAAVLTPRTTRAFAQSLFRIPPDSKQDPFWIGAMHLIGQAVANGMLKKFGRAWTFKGYLKRMESPESIRETVSWDLGSVANQQAMQLLESHSDERLRDNLFATVSEKCGDYHNIAETMQLQYERGQRYPENPLLQQSEVVVFGWDAEVEEELKTFHSAVFTMEVRRALKRHAAEGQLFLLDEVANSGPIGPDLARLSRLGRHTNCIPVLAYHSWPALELELGEKAAAAAVAEQQFVATLACTDARTAEDAQDAFGLVETERTATSTTTSPPGEGAAAPNKTTTEDKPRETKPLISAAQIQHLPLIDPNGDRGPTFFAKDDERNVYAAELPMADVRRYLPRPAKFEPQPFDDAELESEASRPLRRPRPHRPPMPRGRPLLEKLKALNRPQRNTTQRNRREP